MTASGYLRALALGVAAWIALFLAFTWTIDPYRAAPLQVDLPRINALKPKRVDIDRILKPYEVWRTQPRTVFLGTSRFHQSIDPAVLAGTRFAPAYNAAIPNASIGTSIDYLRQYLQLDRNLRTVVVELFLDNFLVPREPPEPKSWSDLAANAVTLLASSDTLWDSIVTLGHNRLNGTPTYEIEPGGYLRYPPGHETQGHFDGFAAWIWSPHYGEPYRMALHQLDSIRELIEIARAHELELILLATPNHAYVDYYWDAVGGWGLIEEWLVELSGQAAVYSFSQPNSWVYEPVAPHMAYWNDTYHFSPTMGRGMLESLAGLEVSGRPDNFMERLTPDRVASHIEGRRQAVRRWAQSNPSFAIRFEEARRKWLASRASREPN